MILHHPYAGMDIGMSEEFQKHIFESFSQERSSSDSGIEGSGLGMGIVKKLVDLMNGKITVQSKPGAGSTFTITLPLKIANAEERNPKHADGQLNTKKLEGKRVLRSFYHDSLFRQKFRCNFCVQVIIFYQKNPFSFQFFDIQLTVCMY